MADPSTSPGNFTMVPNVLLDAILSRLRGLQVNVALLVVRESHGWGRPTTAPMGYKLMSKKMNGVPRSSVQLAVNVLVEAKVLKRHADGSWEIEKDHEIWTLAKGGGGQPTGPGASPLAPRDDAQGASPMAPGGQPTVPQGASPLAPHFIRSLKKERKLKKGHALTRTPCTPPTLDEVKAYCAERGRGVNAAKWHNHYAANGWKVGRVPMVDWRAAVRTWEEGDAEAGTPKAAPRIRCKRCRLDGNWATHAAADGKTPLCDACKEREVVDIETAEAQA